MQRWRWVAVRAVAAVGLAAYGSSMATIMLSTANAAAIISPTAATAAPGSSTIAAPAPTGRAAAVPQASGDLAANAATMAPAATAPTLDAVLAVSCPTASRCWAGSSESSGGAAILASSDGGAQWSVQYTSRTLSSIGSLDCASTTHCVGIGYGPSGSAAAFVETGDGGRHWAVGAAPHRLQYAQSVSCPSAEDCWAIGLAATNGDLAAVARTTDGGVTWTSQVVPSLVTAMSTPFGISCPSTLRCVATGGGSLTTDAQCAMRDVMRPCQ